MGAFFDKFPLTLQESYEMIGTVSEDWYKKERVWKEMKKFIIYLLSATLLFATVSLGIPKTVQAAQRTSTNSTVTKVNTLTGIRKLKKDTVKAVILGDSIAVSQGASKPLTTGWNKDLRRSLFKKYSNNIVWDNKASSGTLVDYCLTRATEIESTTDVVFICVGRNDRNFYKPYQFSNKYTKLIRIIKDKAPNAEIFCIVEPPMVSIDESLFLGIRTAIVKVSAKTGSNLLDVWSAFPKDQVALGALLTDGLHPNDTGYKLMSNYMYNQLVKVINTTGKL